MKQIHFGIIGGGWRSLFFLRIAQAMPEKFDDGASIGFWTSGKHNSATMGNKIDIMRTLWPLKAR